MINLEKIKKEKSIKELINFGIINIDKPSGPTSFSVSQYVKNSLALNKTAHLGTLDPAVTGVLPVALSRACRLNEYLMHRNKVYVGIMRVHKEVSEKDLKASIKKFIGKIMQLPPVKSRVKRAVREREVKSFDILEISGKDVLFSTEVQAGTYIRKLCDDIGKEIGGAHMLELRRTKAGIFDELESVNLYDFDKAVESWKNGDAKLLRDILIPGEIVSSVLPVVQANPKNRKQLLTGKPLMKGDFNDSLPDEERFALFDIDRFIGAYKKVSEGDIIARPEFILN